MVTRIDKDGNMEIYSAISLVFGGLGLGALLNSFVQYRLDERKKKKERLYNERRDAYVGLLESIFNAAVNPSERASKEYALWQTKCDIFGSIDVSIIAAEYANTDPGTEERHKAHQLLLAAIRKDIQT